MDHSQFHELRILINSYRLPNETNVELINRISQDHNLLAQIASTAPTLNFNIGVVKQVITSDNFINQL